MLITMVILFKIAYNNDGIFEAAYAASKMPSLLYLILNNIPTLLSFILDNNTYLPTYVPRYLPTQGLLNSLYIPGR